MQRDINPVANYNGKIFRVQMPNTRGMDDT